MKQNTTIPSPPPDAAIAIENEIQSPAIGDVITYTPKPDGIYAALVAAQSAATGVEKNNRNSHQGYKYASSEAIIAEARECLHSAGLAVMRVASTVTWEDAREVTSKSGPKSVRVGCVRATYSLVHIGGDSLVLTSETPAVVEAGRPEDKAVATALTYSLGYFLRDLLLLPRVEEGTDVDQRDDRAHAAPAPAPALSQTALDLIAVVGKATDADAWNAARNAAAVAVLTDADRAAVKRALASSPARPAPAKDGAK